MKNKIVEGEKSIVHLFSSLQSEGRLAGGYSICCTILSSFFMTTTMTTTYCKCILYHINIHLMFTFQQIVLDSC